jgi:hypothetical protein
MGESFATTDLLNSNLIFRLARSAMVDELVMDSNMMLSGAPASPSVVGLMVSLAQVYPDKKIHYELATERVLPCGDDGQPMHNKETLSQENLAQGASLLLRTGVQHALDAGIDSLGVTNLCQPKLAEAILSVPDPTDTNAKTSSGSTALALKRSPHFTPTAILFVPYRVFYTFSVGISGLDCHHPALPCWHASFSSVPLFGRPTMHRHAIPAGTCPVDFVQQAVLEVWDDLRLRHQHVAVVGDVQVLQDQPQLVAAATERVKVRYPCLMDAQGWHFYHGAHDQRVLASIEKVSPFREHIADAVC